MQPGEKKETEEQGKQAFTQNSPNPEPVFKQGAEPQTSVRSDYGATLSAIIAAPWEDV